MSTQTEYFEQLVTAFIRGKLLLDQQHMALFNKPLHELSTRGLSQYASNWWIFLSLIGRVCVLSISMHHWQ
jgi:hypothetical protein